MDTADRPVFSDAMIERMVRSFYARVRDEPMLAPIFAAAIPGDWEPHLARMCDFWSSVLQTSGRYRGNPMAVHHRIAGITPLHFAVWLALFRQTAEDVLPPPHAADAIMRAERESSEAVWLVASFHRFSRLFRDDIHAA